jgi:hypothetical protein
MKSSVLIGLLVIGLVENIFMETLSEYGQLRDYSRDKLWSVFKQTTIPSNTKNCCSQEAITGIVISSVVVSLVIMVLCLMVAVATWKLYQRIRKSSKLYEII